MKKTNKKGFTIVELVIVIAVIAILAAVLIPTFAGLIQKAKLSSDEVAVRNMNTILATETASDGKPATLGELRSMLTKNGYTEKVIPATADHQYYWDTEENLIILVDKKTDTAVYPAGATYAESLRYLALNGLPDSKMEELSGDELKNKSLHNMNGDNLGVTVDFDAGLRFSALDTEETISSSDYKNYYADFVVTFSKPLTYNENNPSVSDGDVGFMLVGEYTGWNKHWENIPLAISATTGTTANGVQKVRLLEECMRMNLMYHEVVEQVKVFECGVKAVYDNNYSQTFANYNNQTMDSADAEYLNGLQITVELCLFDSNGNQVAVVDTYSCTYHVNNGALTCTTD